MEVSTQWVCVVVKCKTKILPLNSIRDFQFSDFLERPRLPIHPSDKVLLPPAREEKAGGPRSTRLLHAGLRSPAGPQQVLKTVLVLPQGDRSKEAVACEEAWAAFHRAVVLP